MSKRHPHTLTDGDEAVFGEVYPLLAEINERLGKRIELLVLVNVARKLVSLGMDREEILGTVKHHIDHQYEYNNSPHDENPFEPIDVGNDPTTH